MSALEERYLAGEWTPFGDGVAEPEVASPAGCRSGNPGATSARNSGRKRQSTKDDSTGNPKRKKRAKVKGAVIFELVTCAFSPMCVNVVIQRCMKCRKALIVSTQFKLTLTVVNSLQGLYFTVASLFTMTFTVQTK